MEPSKNIGITTPLNDLINEYVDILTAKGHSACDAIDLARNWAKEDVGGQKK